MKTDVWALCARSLCVVVCLGACSQTARVEPSPGSGGAGGTFDLDGSAVGGGITLSDAATSSDVGPPPRLDDSDAFICGREDFKLSRQPPEVLLVLDRSATMGFPVVGSMNTRWTEVSQAVDEVVRETQAKVFWGLKLFPTVSGCMVSDTMEVAVALNDHPAMSTSIKGTAPNVGPNGTPMQQALRTATQHLVARKTPNPKYLVMGTDGLPNCGNGVVGAVDTTGVVAAIKDANTAGVHTFVVGIATHTEGVQAEAALNLMAEAGGEPRMGTPRFFPVNNRLELVNVLNDITTRISSCVFPIAKVPPMPDEVHVKVAGMKIPRDPVNGWSYGPGMRQVILNGAACETVKQVKDDKVLDVQIIFGCPGLVVL